MNIHKPMRLIRTGVALLTPLILAIFLTPVSPAQAQFPNKDTAKNRQDSSWGTRSNESEPYFEDSENGTSWGVIPGEKHEQRDPYKDIIITVDPDVSWPPSGSETTSTTTTHTTANATADTNSTDTTTTTNTW